MPREVSIPSICRTCRTKVLRPTKQPIHRVFSSTPRCLDDGPPPPPTSSLSDLMNTISRQPSSPIGRKLTERTQGITNTLFNNQRAMKDMVPPSTRDTGLSRISMREPPPDPHHLHIYATKHNTHLCLTRPNTEPILSFSAGNIGFRKGQRGSFDAAFQLSSYVFKMMKDRGLLRNATERDMDMEDLGSKTESPIKNMEVILRGFGKGREAVVKAIMGNEGRVLRDKIIRVSDATRLKFGGTRSPKPRRLG
ncbi:hypothetical protein EG328_003555 [Venturia inaequalis]|uniref:Mitochondrial ribosomal protein subunit S18 n=1 Tax=Venturia inaequalis TaxID=5025 RepID=A0A8H3YWW6_VENIN|nr:hypothetical protein EG328_003555 [Venturia inaequalis]